MYISKQAMRIKWLYILSIMCFAITHQGITQHIEEMYVEKLKVVTISGDHKIQSAVNRPLVTFEINGKAFSSLDNSALELTFKSGILVQRGIKGTILFKNTSLDTVNLSNVVPFGREGNVSCIIRFAPTLNVKIAGDLLSGQYKLGSSIKIWKGNPTYEKEPVVIQSSDKNQFSLSLSQILGRYEGKLVVQDFQNDELIDEQILILKPGTPRMVSEVFKTTSIKKLPSEMVIIPAGKFNVKFTQGDEFITYPMEHLNEEIGMTSFAMDRYPVTNEEYQ